MFFNQSGKTIAVISAHPDDETLGAGGSIIKLVDGGNKVFSCVVTQGYAPDWSSNQLATARQEAEEALRTLGVESVRFLGFPTVKLNAVPHKELVDSITGFIADVDPELVLCPSYFDLNPDHGIVARAVAIAVKPTPGKATSLAQFEVPSSSEWGGIMLGERFQPNFYVDISSAIERKLEAVSCFRQELKEYPHPRSIVAVRKLAELRGVEVGLEAAEALRLLVHRE